jgi:hypothetical protein
VPRVVGQKVGTDAAGLDRYAPVVLITIEVGGCIATRPAVIDSGADSTIVPFEFLQACGLDWNAIGVGSPSQSAGGTFESKVLKARVKYREWVVSEEIKVAEPGRLPVALLGRDDFFAKFIVKFRWDKTPPIVDVDPLGH